MDWTTFVDFTNVAAAGATEKPPKEIRMDKETHTLPKTKIAPKNGGFQ